jgi:hypothetical protein
MNVILEIPDDIAPRRDRLKKTNFRYRQEILGRLLVEAERH